MERELVIFGAGGSAREIGSWVDRVGYRLAAFVDDPACVPDGGPERTLHGIPVVHSAQLGEHAARGAAFVAGVGQPRLRGRLVEQALAAGLSPAPALVHPSVEIDAGHVTLGAGTIVCQNATITTDIAIGEHVQVNYHCTVAHDAVIDEFATLSPGVHVSGWVHVGARAFLGTGAVIVDGDPGERLEIGADAVIGAGAVVTADVAAGVTAVGVPARAR